MEDAARNITTTFPNVCLNEDGWGMVITSLAGSLIIIGNVIVVIVILKFPGRHFRPLHWFIVQLAVADLTVGAIVLWIGTLSPMLLHSVSLMYGIIAYGSLASATSTSTMGVLFIAIDRYFYILKHNRYRNIVTKGRVAMAIGVAGLLPTLIFLIGPALGWNCINRCHCYLYNLNPGSKYCFGGACSQMMTPFKKETLLIGGVALFILLVVAIAIYMLILLKVRFRGPAPSHPNRRRSEMRMIKTMIIILVGFLATTGPLAICCIVSFFYNERSLHNIMRVLVMISTFNSILNPFFYFWRMPELHQNLKAIIRRACCHRNCNDRVFSVHMTLPMRRSSTTIFITGGRHLSASSNDLPPERRPKASSIAS